MVSLFCVRYWSCWLSVSDSFLLHLLFAQFSNRLDFNTRWPAVNKSCLFERCFAYVVEQAWWGGRIACHKVAVLLGGGHRRWKEFVVEGKQARYCLPNGCQPVYPSWDSPVYEPVAKLIRKVVAVACGDMVRCSGVFVGEGEDDSLHVLTALATHAQKNAFSKGATIKRPFWFLQLHNTCRLERMSAEDVF